MIAARTSRKEFIALATVATLILALVGFISWNDNDGIEIEDSQEVSLDDLNEGKVPDRAQEIADQKLRELKGLPTKLGTKVDGRSHLHGGYGATFRVVDEESGTGVSGAVVLFMPQKAASEIDWKWRREDVVRRSGRRLKADHWGDVRIQSFIGSALVICEHKGKYGELYIKSFYDVMTKKNELKIKTDPAVKIQVIDAKGRGVRGVPVALWRDNFEANLATKGRAPRRILIWTGTTYGPSGIAFARRSLGQKSSKFASDDGWDGPLAAQLSKGGIKASFYFPPLIPQTLFDELNAQRNTDTLNDASGITRALLEQVVEVNITSEGPQCRPLELPATGAIKLVLYQDDGSLYEDACVVWIGSYSGQREKGPSNSNKPIDFDPKLQSISAGSVPFMANRGVVVLPHVGLFSTFDITVMPINKSHDAVEMVVNGPTQARQIRTIAVPLGPERPIFTGLIQDSEGNAFALEKIDIAMAIPGVGAEGAAVKRQRVKTDKDGRFEIRVPVEFVRYEKVEMRIVALRKNPLELPPSAAALIKAPSPATVSDAGVFKLSRRGLICRGRVLNELKRPVAGASILILRNPFPYQSKRQNGDSRVHALTQAADVQVQVAAITSNKQGYFTFGGYIYDGIWEMVVSHGEGMEAREARFEFTPGEKNMQVRIDLVPQR